MPKNISNKIKLALLGKNIQHSLSPSIYQNFLGSDLEYTIIDVLEEKLIPTLDDIFKEHVGLSITAPYKQHFLSHLIPTKEARNIGAVNCIRKNPDGTYGGTLTDYAAFDKIFFAYFLDKTFDTIVIFGSGMMAKMVEEILKNLNLEYVVLDRKSQSLEARTNLIKFGQVLVINCCARDFIFAGEIKSGSSFYDFNYSHEHEKSLCRTGEIHYFDGKELLELQAKFALDFWNLSTK